jgi:hypothetical protein
MAKKIELKNFSVVKKEPTNIVVEKAVEKIHATPSVSAPTTKDDNAITRMSIDVPLEFRITLQNMAARRKTRMAKLVREILEEYVKNNS